MKISIIIPNWNGKEKLKKNLPKVLDVEGIDEVIVVDDKSDDDSVAFLKKNFSQVKLIEKINNTGFSSAVNEGVKHSIGDLIFLLNTDAVPSPDCLNFITPHFKDPKVFSVGCNTGGNWSWAKWENGWFVHFMAPLKHGEKPQTHETLWVSGGSGVFRKSIWKELDGLDEVYDPFYVEDLDLGYRAWKRGYINIWEVDAKVEHYKEKGVIATHFSESKIQKISERNTLFFIWKNIHDSRLINQHIRHLTLRLLTNPQYFQIVFNALEKILIIKKERKLEKEKSVRTDGDLLGRFT